MGLEGRADGAYREYWRGEMMQERGTKELWGRGWGGRKGRQPTEHSARRYSVTCMSKTATCGAVLTDLYREVAALQR